MAKKTTTEPVLNIPGISEHIAAYFDSPTDEALANVARRLVEDMGGAYIELTTRRFCYLLKTMSDEGDRLTGKHTLETVWKAMQYRTTGIEKWLKAGGGQS